MSSVQVFTYSPNNTKANAYYTACRRFNNAQDKLLAYEQKSGDRDSGKYQQLLNEFNLWDKKVPETSKIAAKEERQIAKSIEKNKTENQGPNLSIAKGSKLNLLA